MTTTTSGSQIRYAALVDTETQGLDPKVHQTIEVAVTLFDVKRGQPVASYASLIRHESNAAEAINGIPPAMLIEAPEAEVVWRCVKWLIQPAQVLIAHQASFDRQFCPPLEKPWVCTIADIEWPGGRRSNHLASLALGLGLGVSSAHRASADVDVLSRVLTRLHEMGTDLEAMLVAALRPKLRCVALVSYNDRQKAKDLGFQWDDQLRQWWRDVPIDEVDNFPIPIRKGTLPAGEP